MTPAEGKPVMPDPAINISVRKPFMIYFFAVL
jgi:hypothetical protein